MGHLVGQRSTVHRLVLGPKGSRVGAGLIRALVVIMERRGLDVAVSDEVLHDQHFLIVHPSKG